VQEEKEEGEGAETGSERGRQKKKGKGKRKGAWGLREPERVGVDRKFRNLRLAVDSVLRLGETSCGRALVWHACISGDNIESHA